MVRERGAAVLPAKGKPRELTRSEAAKLKLTCWRYREVETALGSLRGQKIETDKRPLRHLARFILIWLYTGTRAGDIASASLRREECAAFVRPAGSRDPRACRARDISPESA